MKGLLIILSGFLFGLGMIVSNMADPNEVLNFLNILNENWSYNLMLVMGFAVIIYMMTVSEASKKKKTMFKEDIILPKNNKIDSKLLLGASLFGFGWGIAGLCPSNLVAGIAFMPVDILYFIGFYILGVTIIKVSQK